MLTGLAQSAIWQPTRSTKSTELEPSFELISQGAGLGTKQVLDFCGPRLHAGRVSYRISQPAENVCHSSIKPSNCVWCDVRGMSLP